MNDLERLELILRRIAAQRAQSHAENKTTLNIDTQDLLKDIADEIALSIRASAK